MNNPRATLCVKYETNYTSLEDVGANLSNKIMDVKELLELENESTKDFDSFLFIWKEKRKTSRKKLRYCRWHEK